jgi:hypothetical protein
VEEATADILIERLAGIRIKIRLKSGSLKEPFDHLLGSPVPVRYAVLELLDSFN